MNWILITICLISGILCGQQVGSSLAVFLLLSTIFVCIIKLFIKIKIKPTMLLAVAAFCCGVCAVNMAMIKDTVIEDYVSHYVTLDGMVLTTPQKSQDNYHYTILLNKISLGDAVEEKECKILLSTDKYLDVGTQIKVEGTIKHFDNARNEYGFDPQMFYKSKAINYKIYSEKVYASDSKFKSKLLVFPTIIKQSMSNMIFTVLKDDNTGIVNAILTGNSSFISDDLKEILKESGAQRYLYFSYFFIFIVLLLMSFLNEKISRRKRTWLTVALIILLAIINSDRSGFVKASVFLVCVLLVENKFGYVYRLDVLCWVVIAMLLANPLLLYNGGFVLSVTATFLMQLFGDKINEYFNFINSKSIRKFIKAFIVYTLGLAPVAAYYYNGLSLYSVLLLPIYMVANAIIWIFFFPIYGMIKLFGNAPILSGIFTFAIALYKKLPYFVSKLPFAYINIATPNIALLIMFVLLIIMLYRKSRNKNIKPCFVTICICVIAFLVAQIPKIGTVEFIFVNVGQADGAIVSLPYMENIIIDGGGNPGYTDYNSGKYDFVPYLKSHGKSHIDAAFVSHYHSDHAQGVIDVINELDVDMLYLPDIDRENPIRKQLEEMAKKENTSITYINEDINVKFKGGLEFDVIFPSENIINGNDNDASIMINAKYGEINCLFTGDMSKYSENDLISKNKAPEAEILKVAHHGSATSTGKEWVEAVNPEIAVISLGENNMYNFPREAVLDNLKYTSLYRTDLNGDITIIANKHKINAVHTQK